MEASRRCAVIGLGEAGRRYAEALVSLGYDVRGYDPRPNEVPQGVTLAESELEAVRGADVVFVVSVAAAARSIALRAADGMKPHALYCDLTSSSPDSMLAISRNIEAAGAAFVDVAILGPVTVRGAETPVLLSGSGSERASDVFTRLNAHVDVIDGPAGAAVSHKLLRSVFMKGLAAVVCEAVDAGTRAGAADWVRGQIATVLAGDGQSVIDRFVTGTAKHADRRADEMMAAEQYLQSLPVAHEMTSASAAALARIAQAGAATEAGDGKRD